MNLRTTQPTGRRAGTRPARGALLAALGLTAALALTGCGGSSAAAGVRAAPAGSGSAGPSAPSGSATPGSAGPSGAASSAAPGGAGPTGSAGPSPTGSPTGSTAEGPLAGRTIVVDPGHNPNNVNHTAEINQQVDVGNGHKECDTTGTSTDAGYTEADFTLDVSHRLRDLLRSLGATVILTQDGDRPYGPCVTERAAIGNDAHADAAISVHGDGGPASGSGFHVIMPAKVVAGQADTTAITEPSHRLGLLVRDDFQHATGEQFADYVADHGLDTRDDLGGLNLSKVPKVFIECGNMRNAGDAQRMTDPQWRQRAAQGTADAFAAFLSHAGATPGPTG
ncbi:N-acetylmuramoyl-L-alanine amidase [Kitasatospora sp. RB6PN24]|uniref:N-acetylmuramoyl-L-alanine amidase n=1 Tax=Kitasatospora humi TaxID=2893891 RepID=UPI001E4F9363|nr:N-acetylmuramoyl-L-alanine amidase [Kitasatospora humi]MCC9311057.1 N-acetylmuramoyl-L-alanine amidase [Kitasatospora humi]